ncbi:MAG TPA: PAS domain S-box protein [Meiothermus sp.]|nr:PAS domain S-box protein [Meiothermus sp.]
MTPSTDPKLAEDLLDDLEQIVWRLDVQGQVVYLNRRGSEYTGYECPGWAEDQAVHPPFTEHFHPDDHAALLERWQQVSERGEPLRFEARLRSKEGAYRWFSCYLAPREDPQGRGRVYTLSCTDIEERKAAEQALRESEARFRTLFAHAPAAILIADREGQLNEVNLAAEQLLGYPPGALWGKPLQALIRSEEIPRLEETLQRGGNSDPANLAEHRGDWELRRGDGSWVWAEVSSLILPDGRWLAFAHDVSERRRVASEREQLLVDVATERALIDRILETAPVGLCFLDTELRYQRVNEALAEMNGIPPEDHLGRRPREVLPQLAETLEPILQRVLEQGEAVLGLEVEGETPKAPGQVRSWLTSWYPVFRATGETLGIGAVVLEITERKKAEDALRQSEARLRALVEAQKRFVADASHELRAPLTAIQGNLEILRRFRHMKQADRQAALDEAAREAQRLARLVNDLLALARGDAGARLHLQPVGLRELLLEVFEEARHLADGHHLELGEVQDLWVQGHRDRLKQVLIILLDNAFKYTPPGGTIRLGLSEQGGRARIRLEDSGIGIAAEDLPYVFERFYRVDESRSQQSGGSGLGLSIAKWIVEQHGGEIWLQSQVGQGTTAFVELPARLDRS